MSSISSFSPAKLNTTLCIGSFDEVFGKHAVSSHMQKISLADTLEITKTQRKKIQITVCGPYKKGVPNNEHNIVYTAAKKFFDRYGFSFGIEIILTKNISNGAGLGGGSSNAAEILKYLHAEKNIPLIPAHYVDLGSDIPFFLQDSSSGMVSGVGEKFEERNLGNSYFGVLVFPRGISISTAWAFRQLKTRKYSTPVFDIPPEQNTFLPVMCSFFPEIEDVLRNISSFQPNIYGMSGSGSTLFALFDSTEKQQSLFDVFSQEEKKHESICFEIIE